MLPGFCCVVPTRVGMVRGGTRSATSPSQLSPRVWGWSAVLVHPSLMSALSPRVWGWSVTAMLTVSGVDAEVKFVPTRVGMVRMAQGLDYQSPRSRERRPH